MIVGIVAFEGRARDAEARLAAAAPGSTTHRSGDGAIAVAVTDRGRAEAAAGWVSAEAGGVRLRFRQAGRQTLLRRDAPGDDGLFWASDDEELRFAGEIEPLLALGESDPGPDTVGLAGWLARRPLGARTVVRGVSELLPGHTMQLHDGRVQIARHWAPSPVPGLDRLKASDAAAVLREAVLAAVDRAAPPRPAVSLSGGLDSAVVLAGAARRGEHAAFSAAFPGRPAVDERGRIEAAAALTGAALTVVEVDRPSLAPYMDRYASRWGVPCPTPGGGIFHPVLEAAASAGHDVVLDGEGGDELFGCEPLLLADRLRRLDVAGGIRVARRVPGMPRRPSRRHLRVLAKEWVLPGLAVHPTADPAQEAPSWLQVVPPPAALPWRGGRPAWRSHLTWQLTDARDRAGVADVLRRAAAMAGLRARHPLLDTELVQVVLGLPPELAFDAGQDRALLRRAVAGLIPEETRTTAAKPHFSDLLVDALVGPDATTVGAVLGDGASALGGLVDAEAVRRLWDGGPEGHPSGRLHWAAECWRLYGAASWLQRG